MDANFRVRWFIGNAELLAKGEEHSCGTEDEADGTDKGGVPKDSDDVVIFLSEDNSKGEICFAESDDVVKMFCC